MRSLIFYREDNISGIKLCYDDGSGTAKAIAYINGNHPEHRGPVALLGLDAHIIYAMSQPKVISRILAEGPQTLIATKELAHTLFEHGMKASVGKIKVGKNPFITGLDTFYKTELKSGDFTIHPSTSSLIIQMHGLPPVVVCTNGGTPPVVGDNQELVDLSRLLNYTKLDFE